MVESVRSNPRDEFPPRLKRLLEKRVNGRCSNPNCRKATSGPHQDPEKSVNVGFAAHITAARPRGPRYDAALTNAERSSANNGIWLCGGCAKLVDSDLSRYTVAFLRAWKHDAEQAALLELETKGNLPKVREHLPAEFTFGISYHEARELLIGAGWQPVMTWWPDQLPSLDIRIGNGKEFWRRGYREIKSTCPTGFAFCRFEFRDAHMNALAVITAGEEWPEQNWQVGVVSWFFRLADVTG